MFYNCTALKSAPVIGLTTAVASCCYGMFQGCTSLTTAPEINAIITGDFSTNRYCFQNMFAGCTSLISIPALKNTDVTYYCYAGMFYGCSALKFSTEQTIECPNEFRIPSTGTATQYGSTSTYQMIKQTSGTFTSDPAINTTYYTNATII